MGHNQSTLPCVPCGGASIRNGAAAIEDRGLEKLPDTAKSLQRLGISSLDMEIKMWEERAARMRMNTHNVARTIGEADKENQVYADVDVDEIEVAGRGITSNFKHLFRPHHSKARQATIAKGNLFVIAYLRELDNKTKALEAIVAAKTAREEALVNAFISIGMAGICAGPGAPAASWLLLRKVSVDGVSTSLEMAAALRMTEDAIKETIKISGTVAGEAGYKAYSASVQPYKEGQIAAFIKQMDDRVIQNQSHLIDAKDEIKYKKMMAWKGVFDYFLKPGVLAKYMDDLCEDLERIVGLGETEVKGQFSTSLKKVEQKLFKIKNVPDWYKHPDYDGSRSIYAKLNLAHFYPETGRPIEYTFVCWIPTWVYPGEKLFLPATTVPEDVLKNLPSNRKNNPAMCPKHFVGGDLDFADVMGLGKKGRESWTKKIGDFLNWVAFDK